METAISYLTGLGWEISSDPRNYEGYPNNYGYRNFWSDDGKINYDAFCGGYHRAYDFYSNETNNVPAVTAGTVITAEKRGNFGGTVEVRDANGNDWIYGHLQRDSIVLKVGDIVQQGDLIGLQGNSNYYDNKMAVHLHLQLRPKGTDLKNEVAEVCSGMDMAKYDISKLKTTKEGIKMGKKILLTAGHGGTDPGAVGNGTNERDFIRNNIVDNVAKYLKQAGHNVEVFDKNYDMLTWTFHQSKQYGLYWAKAQKFDEVIEFHLDAASPSATGGHVIIWGGFAPDKVDTGLQKALSDTVGVIRPISKRTDLGNARIAAEIGVSYRLVELGFITSKKDMDYIKKNLQSFTKRLAEGINGATISEPKKTATKPKTAEKQKTPSKTAKAKTPETHTVVKGDTIWGITKKYGITHEKLVELNNSIKDKNYKDNTILKVGTVLKIK